MPTRNFIIATAGHVDHGKSALVKTLTAIDPDRLPEEKARGMTIDLGFAQLELPSPNDSSLLFHIGVIDVPGHEDFVKNMVAGVGSADAALFVVAADDGWMPQSEEHLQILTYLGLNRAVFALTRMDLAASDAAERVAQLKEKLRATAFQNAPIVKTSIETGEGIEELKKNLAVLLDESPPPRNFGKPRLPVDRVFALRGIGTVVTGTLAGGSIETGQSVVIQPQGNLTRIRNIQSHNRDLTAGKPGARIALNLPNVSSGRMPSSERVSRGHVVTLPGLGKPGRIADVLLEKSDRLTDSSTRTGQPLENATRVRIHHGTANTPARIFFFKVEPLHPGQKRLARLHFEAPVFLFAGDRFVVRDWSERETIAGGSILDPTDPEGKFRFEKRKVFLSRRAANPGKVEDWISSRLYLDKLFLKDQILVQSNFSAEEIAAGLQSMEDAGTALLKEDFAADRKWWENLWREASNFIDSFHQNYPERMGPTLSGLRKTIRHAPHPKKAFNALLDDLCEKEFVKTGITIRRQTHTPALPLPLREAARKLRFRLAERPLDPPSRGDLVKDNPTRQALHFLLQSGEIVAIGEKVILSSQAVKQAGITIQSFLREKGPATVSEIRRAMGTSRRVLVPLLEFFDREGLTMRRGDQRLLR